MPGTGRVDTGHAYATAPPSYCTYEAGVLVVANENLKKPTYRLRLERRLHTPANDRPRLDEEQKQVNTQATITATSTPYARSGQGKRSRLTENVIDGPKAHIHHKSADGPICIRLCERVKFRNLQRAVAAACR